MQHVLTWIVLLVRSQRKIRFSGGFKADLTSWTYLPDLVFSYDIARPSNTDGFSPLLLFCIWKQVLEGMMNTWSTLQGPRSTFVTRMQKHITALLKGIDTSFQVVPLLFKSFHFWVSYITFWNFLKIPSVFKGTMKDDGQDTFWYSGLGCSKERYSIILALNLSWRYLELTEGSNAVIN
jgi:hypothetical protein